MQAISMARTLLSCLHSSDKPPNKMHGIRPRGNFTMNMKFPSMVYLFGTAETDQAMGIFDYDNGHEIE
jgi:hypothetical protein